MIEPRSPDFMKKRYFLVPSLRVPCRCVQTADASDLDTQVSKENTEIKMMVVSQVVEP